MIELVEEVEEVKEVEEVEVDGEVEVDVLSRPLWFVTIELVEVKEVGVEDDEDDEDIEEDEEVGNASKPLRFVNDWVVALEFVFESFDEDVLVGVKDDGDKCFFVAEDGACSDCWFIVSDFGVWLE